VSMKSEASPFEATSPEVPPLLASLLASIERDPLTECWEESMPTRHSSATIATALHAISALPLHDDLPHTHNPRVLTTEHHLSISSRNIHLTQFAPSNPLLCPPTNPPLPLRPSSRDTEPSSRQTVVSSELQQRDVLHTGGFIGIDVVATAFQLCC
jgi:hypothetical protein